VISFSLLALAAGAVALHPAEIRHELTHDPACACWRVHVSATGIDPQAGTVRLVLPDWGEWTAVDAYYLRELESHPRAQPDPESSNRFIVEPPAGWDGTLDLTYVLPLARFGSQAQQAHPLLPRHDGTDAAGFSINTLLELEQGAEPIEGSRHVRFVAPQDTTIATGWGGISTTTQEVQFEHPIDNVPLLFGRAIGVVRGEADALRFEVAQFGPGPDRTADVLGAARALIPLYGKNSGRPYGETVRLFLTPLTSGGTNTDHGSILSYRADDFEGGLSIRFIRLLSHEMFHIWLGGYLKPEDESLVWFHEGFTEYLAMWHVVAAGLAEPDWLAERALSLEAEARRSSAFGRVAFGDPGVRWRDDNGPNETLGYKGGATLALLTDVELRREGRPGLMRLIADLLRQGAPLSLESIRAWMNANGLADFYGQLIARPAALPDVGSALVAMGFEPVESDASLTYLGIRVREGDASREIEALDPEGPAARAGFAIGDRIVDCAPTRPNPPRIREGVETPYRFGLNTIASGAKVATIEVERSGKRLALEIEPRLIAGGVRTSYRAGAETRQRFFR
jgi:hypothetical protein